MVHVVVGLFSNINEAGKAIDELKKSGFTHDVSVISKDAITGKIHLYQVKQKETMLSDEEIGAGVGTLAGAIGGLSAVLNPTLDSPPIIAAIVAVMGITGATLGSAVGGYIGEMHNAGFPPERAKMYKNKIKKGEVFVAVSDVQDSDKKVRSIFEKFHATQVHAMESER